MWLMRAAFLVCSVAFSVEAGESNANALCRWLVLPYYRTPSASPSLRKLSSEKTGGFRKQLGHSVFFAALSPRDFVVAVLFCFPQKSPDAVAALFFLGSGLHTGGKRALFGVPWQERSSAVEYPPCRLVANRRCQSLGRCPWPAFPTWTGGVFWFRS